MYQVIPLLLILAILMPWTGPADPGNRMAAANAADGVAEQALIYHQAALAYVRANPATSGTVALGSLPGTWRTNSAAACARSGIVATYVTVPSTISAPAVAAAIGRLWAGYPLVGLTTARMLTNAFTGVPSPLPCSLPDNMPVVLSQAGG
jgi:hypothetical protein